MSSIFRTYEIDGRRVTEAEYGRYVSEHLSDMLAEAWDKGFEDGSDQEMFYSRGLSTDSDADTFPRRNPYRAAHLSDTERAESEPDRCTSQSEDGRRCHGDVGHRGTHWAGASRVWSDTERAGGAG